MNLKNFNWHASQNANEYAQVLWTKALCRWPAYDEYRLKGTLIEGQEGHSDKALEVIGINAGLHR